MPPYIRFGVQPIPYSRSLLYPLLNKNTAFLQWYQTFTQFDEVYRHTHRSPLLTYNYTYQYQTQPKMHFLNKYSAVDNITCDLCVFYNNKIYAETIRHKVHYVPHSGAHSWGLPNTPDYIIQTYYSLKLDGDRIKYHDVDKQLLENLHL
jgi:hypothetical protein